MVKAHRATKANRAINSTYAGPDVPLRFRYHTYEFGAVDIHVRSLRDTQQYQDPLGSAELLGISPANWSLFGIVWDSSQILAHVMADYSIADLRILELGCGLGLSSLLLNKRGADITATDYHPEVGASLQKNALLNSDDAIPFTRMNWEDKGSALGRFDLIIGSDILYEQGHAALLSSFIDRHTRAKCTVIIVDPGRKQHAKFSKAMVKNGFSHRQNNPEDDSYLSKPFGGKILTYSRIPVGSTR